MCNLYRMTSPAAEAARLFGAEMHTGSNASGEIYPGYPALVVALGQLRSMVWGFPLAIRGKSGRMLKSRPVNNTRADKLMAPFWKASFAARRCLIPLSAWAEAEGPTGAKTRSWLSAPDGALLSCAGIWSGSDEWGDVFSMVMCDAAGTAAQVHHRMPVIVRPEDRATWQSGSEQSALALCRPYQEALAIERTQQRWSGSASLNS